MVIKTIENMAVIALDVDKDTFIKVGSFDGAATCLKGEDGEEIFRVCVCENPLCGGSIGHFGAEFSVSGDKLLLWIAIPEDAVGSKEDKKNFLMEEYGVSLANIKKIEAQIKLAIDAINTKISSVEGCIVSV